MLSMLMLPEAPQASKHDLVSASAMMMLPQAPKVSKQDLIFRTAVTMLPTAPQPSNEVFRFLDLTAELRIMIYRCALPKEVRVRPMGHLARRLAERRDGLAFLFTCHQIRNEARPLLFSDSLFHIELIDSLSMEHCLHWADEAGDRLVRRIKHFSIGVSGASLTTWGCFVVIKFRAEKAGPIVECSRMGVQLLDRPTTFAFLPSDPNTLADPIEPQQVVSDRFETRAWLGYFSAADLMIIFFAIYKRMDLDSADWLIR